MSADRGAQDSVSRIVLTCGVFDLFHAGHATYLKKCASLGDELIVAVMTDRWTEHFKKKKPIFNERDRSFIVSSIKGVKSTLLMDQIDPTLAMRMTRCNVFVHGNDWLHEGEDISNVRLPSSARAHMLAHRVELVLVPYTDGVSSSEVRAKL
jgi:glycerol-3-phosphate cytidylyltransferase